MNGNMNDIDHVLVIADLPYLPKPLALEYALLLDPATRIDVCAFVYEPSVEDRTLLSEAEADSARQKLLDDRKSQLEQAVSELGANHQNVTVQAVWSNRIAEWVNEACGRNHYDLVMKTGHRSETLGHTPTDWQLLRNCDVPIYIASPNHWRPRRTCLATVDVASRRPAQKKLNRKVLEKAQRIARQAGAELHIGYALHISQVMRDLEIFSDQEYMQRFGKSHGKELQSLAKEFCVPEDRVHVEVGSPARMIPRIANSINAALVVMGTMGRKGLAGSLLGNTAENVLHILRTDVLTIPPGDD